MSFPTKDDLTLEMKKCFACKSDFICTGVPGTGKTVVAFHKFKELKDEGKKVKFICFNKLLNLFLNDIGNQFKDDIRTIDSWSYEMRKKTRLFLQPGIWFLDLSEEQIKEIFTKYIEILGYKYNWIIIDEGQDFGVNFYKNSHILADNIAVFMDDHQKLKGTSILIGDVETQLYEASGESPRRFTLTHVFRSPKSVYEFAKAFIPNDLVANDPALLDNLIDSPAIVEDYHKDTSMFDKIKEIIENDYLNGKTVGIFAERTKEVEDIKRDFCNMFGNEWRNNMIVYNSKDSDNFSWEGKILLSNYDCAKGLEFDTVILMAPSGQDADNLTANKLYTLCTRSKGNLYLFI